MRADEKRLRQLMSTYVGVIRSGAGLAGALGEIVTLEAKAKSSELKDMATAALMIAAAAFARTESRGAHFRSDFPQPDHAQAKRNYFTLDEARVIANRAIAKAA
jgi:L-aspartate oxidase